MNLDLYKYKKPKNVIQHDSYEISKSEMHKIQSDYSKAPKAYKDRITLYEAYNEEALAHYGTRGQKWGVRKWQNYDGTFNEAGKQRYFGSGKKETNTGIRKGLFKIAAKMADRMQERQMNKWNNDEEYRDRKMKNTINSMKMHRKYYDMEDLDDDEIEKLAKAMVKKGVADMYEVKKEVNRYKSDKDHYFDDVDIEDMRIYDYPKASEIDYDTAFGSYGPKKSDNSEKVAKEMKKTVKSLNKKGIDIDDSDVEDINKFNKTVKNLNDDYEKHNEIILNKLADMYYNAYKNTYGYEEKPLSKAEFKKTFENIRGTLHSDGILEGYTESDVNDSFSNGYYFNYDVLNKIVSDIESD